MTPDTGSGVSQVSLDALRCLIVGVCHEITSPLMAVQGLIELLAQGEEDPARRQDLQVVLEEAARAIAIVKNLRSFGGTGEQGLTLCSLTTIMSEVIDTRRYETQARGIRLDVSLDPNVPPVLSRSEDLLLCGLLLFLGAEQLTVATADWSASTMSITTAVGVGSVQAVVEIQGAAAASEAALPGYLKAARTLASGLGGSLSVEGEQPGRTLRFTLALPSAAA